MNVLWARASKHRERFVVKATQYSRAPSYSEVARAFRLVERHHPAIMLEVDDVSYLALGGELQASGHIHIVELGCECTREAFGYL